MNNKIELSKDPKNFNLHFLVLNIFAGPDTFPSKQKLVLCESYYLYKSRKRQNFCKYSVPITHKTICPQFSYTGFRFKKSYSKTDLKYITLVTAGIEFPM